MADLIDPDEAAAREARHWILRLNSGDMSRADVEALARWRDANPVHRQSLARASLSLDRLRAAARNLSADAVVRLDQTQARTSTQRVAHETSRPIGRRMLMGGALAASAAALAVATVRPPLDLWPSIAELTASYRTATGEQRQVVFADRVTVDMDTRTSLVVAGTQADAREIELISGQIAVTTKGALDAAFVVIAGAGRTLSEGGTFDLRRDGQRTSVTCLDGKLRVDCRGSVMTLGPSQQIVYDDAAVSSIVAVDPGSVASWRRGLLVFEGRPLSQVIDEINRYRSGKIILLNADLGRLPLDATFRLDRIEEAVPKIAHVFGARVRTLPGGVVLLS